MIVIGVDVHKHSLTAVAVDEFGRECGTWSGPVGVGLLVWARSADGERLWAVGAAIHQPLDHELLWVVALLEDRGPDRVERVVIDSLAEEEGEQGHRQPLLVGEQLRGQVFSE